jgi:uncharacterized membrane protein YczE
VGAGMEIAVLVVGCSLCAAVGLGTVTHALPIDP